MGEKFEHEKLDKAFRESIKIGSWNRDVKLSDFADLAKTIDDPTVIKMFLEFKKHFGIMIPTIRTGDLCNLTIQSEILTKDQYLKLLECIKAEIELLESFVKQRKTIKSIFFKQLNRF